MAEKTITVPATIEIKNTSEVEVAFRYYRVNFVEKLAAGDSVVLTVASSEEYAYYLALADEKIGLTVTAKTEEAGE